MPITFSCENCHSSFTVDGQLAGRTARCRKCNHRMVIPAADSVKRPVLASAEKLAGDRASPRRPATAGRKAGVASAAALRQPANKGSSRPSGWLDAVNSQIGLKPISMMAAPSVRQKDLDDFDDDGPSQYKLVIPREMRKKSVIVTKPAEIAAATYWEGIRSYRQFFNLFAILFRWINETAYAVSLIFLNVAIVGAIMSKHSLVVLGISLVILLNLVQLVAGISNLIAIQFRGNVVKGLLFLFPPVTAYYLWKNWYRWNKAIKRITSPIIWLVVVTVAYTYIPWLNGSKKGMDLKGAVEALKKDVKGTVSDLQQKAAELEQKLPGEIEKAKLDTKFDDLKKSAGEAIDELRSKAGKAVGGERPPENPGSSKPAESAPKQEP